MLTHDKIIEIFCIADDFCKKFSQEIKKHQIAPKDGKKHRNRSCEMSDSEIITILLLFHYGTFKNFKHFYLHYIGIHLQEYFPKQLSYNRFVAVEHRVFIPMKLFGKLFGDKGYISSALFETLFDNGVHLVTGMRNNMKNRLMSLYDKIMLRKRSVIETINDQLKNICEIEHSRHRAVHNFVMNLVSALAAYCFFDKKPAIRFERGLPTGQMALFA